MLELIAPKEPTEFERSLIVPKELTAPEHSLIVSHFKALPKAGAMKRRHFDCNLPNRPPLFIKHGDDVLAEAITLSFFYARAQNSESAPLIPKVFDAFCQERNCFFVMEKINATTLEECDIEETEAVEKFALAVKWLFDQMPSVPSSVFGRISSEEDALVWHRFFKDHQAPVPFVNSQALLKYVLEAFRRRPKRGQLTGEVSKRLSASLLEDRVIYYSDIRKNNFLIDTATGRFWIIDFQHIGVLLKAFQTYAFFNTDDEFAAAVGSKLRYERSIIADTMAKASSILQQCGGNASLGLDKFGEPNSRKA